MIILIIVPAFHISYKQTLAIIPREAIKLIVHYATAGLNVYSIVCVVAAPLSLLRVCGCGDKLKNYHSPEY